MCLSIEGGLLSEHKLFLCRSQTVRFCLCYTYLTCSYRHYSPASLSCHTHSLFCVNRCIITNRSKYFRVMVTALRTYRKQQLVHNFLRFVLSTYCDILLQRQPCDVLKQILLINTWQFIVPVITVLVKDHTHTIHQYHNFKVYKLYTTIRPLARSLGYVRPAEAGSTKIKYSACLLSPKN